MDTIQKHMDLLQQKDVQQLIIEREGPCVSLYMPTQRHAPEVQQNPIRFKNLINKVETQLGQYGLDQDAIDALLGPVTNEINTDFWNYTSDGLALFVAPGFHALYRLPYSFDPFVLVSDNFYIRQLLPLINHDEQFYVLTLNQDHVALLRGNRQQMDTVELGDVATSLAEAMQYDEFQPHVQFRSTGGGAPGHAMFHGQGTSADDATRKENILRFFKILDNAVCDLLNADGSPLILAGVDMLRGLYRQVNHYNNLLDDAIEINPQNLDHKDIHQHAWTIVEPLTKQVHDDVLASFYKLHGADDDRATDNVTEIVPAAYYQRIDTLVLSDNQHKWGAFHADDNNVVIKDEFEVGHSELLNDAAIHTLRNGGDVHTVNTLDNDRSALAILRY